MNFDGTLAISVIFTGLTIVFVALVVLTLIVSLIGKLFTSTQSGGKKQNIVSPATPTIQKPIVTQSVEPTPPAHDGIDDEVIAVISAAVALMSTGSEQYVVKSVKRVREARPAWGVAGVLQNTQPF